MAGVCGLLSGGIEHCKLRLGSLKAFLLGFPQGLHPHHGQNLPAGLADVAIRNWAAGVYACVCTHTCESVPAPTGSTIHFSEFSCFLVGAMLGLLLSGGGRLF